MSPLEALVLNTKNPGLQAQLIRLKRFARANEPILIEGETGTGKTHLARFFHSSSPRAGRPFGEYTLSAAHDEIVNSDLFGHVKGAFTGANQAREGVIRRSHTGIVFLDELGKASAVAQRRLLELVEFGRIRPMGSDVYEAVDCQIVSASNVPLETLVTRGTFLPDLAYRLSAFPVMLPPLRERPEDIPAIADWLLAREQAARHLKQPPITASEEFVELCAADPWHGNLRELRNFIARLVILHDPGDVLTADAFMRERTPGRSSALKPRPDAAAARAAMARNSGNKTRAAKALDIHRSTLYRLLQ